MIRHTYKYAVVAGVLLGTLGLTGQRAEACWGWRWWRPVVWWTPCYSYCWWDCWSPCVWDCCAVCGCYDCCYTTVSYVVSCCEPVEVKAEERRPTPAPPQQPGPSETPEAPGQPKAAPEGPATSASPMKPDAAMLTIEVPAEARVIINGRATRSRGPLRKYVSYGLKPGRVYKYEIRAIWTEDGQQIEDTKIVYLSPGVSEEVAFYRLPAEQLARAK